MSDFNGEGLAWEKMEGLLPTVVQHAHTGQVLMVAYMNREAFHKTIETKKVTFYSRSRKGLWTKGETSGNFLQLVKIEEDCDGDALLVQVEPAGPTCHRNTFSCFGSGEQAGGVGWLMHLTSVIESRKGESAEKSYTASLMAKGINRMAQKVGEEGVETALAAATNGDNFIEEASDLLFHLMVLLSAKDQSLKEVVAQLESRHKK